MKSLVMFSFLLLGETILMAQSLARPNPPIGQQFYDTYNSISLTCRSNNGIAWTVVNSMRSGVLKVSFTVQSNGQSVREDVILNSYSPIKNGSMGQDGIGGASYEEYRVSGSATCDNIPSDHVGCIGFVSVSYYGEGT